jgi:hypothetical protein
MVFVAHALKAGDADSQDQRRYRNGNAEFDQAETALTSHLQLSALLPLGVHTV